AASQSRKKLRSPGPGRTIGVSTTPIHYALGSPLFFFFSSRRRHTRWPRDWSSDVCSSDLAPGARVDRLAAGELRNRRVERRARHAHTARHRAALADRILGALRTAQAAAGAAREVAAALQQLREALPRHADVDVRGERAVGDLDAADLLGARHQSLAQ